jgi:hypothetical protein
VWQAPQFAAKTEVTVEPPSARRKLTTKKWLTEEVNRRAVGHKPIPSKIGEFRDELREEMEQAKADGVVAKVVSKGRIENLLREDELWPVKKPPE